MRTPGFVRLALLLALASLGCSSRVRPEVLAGWVGKPATALVQDWGPATREVPDGGLRVLIYEQLERATAGDFQTRQVNPRNTYGRAQELDQIAPTPHVYVRSYLFWVDRDGVIVRSAVRE